MRNQLMQIDPETGSELYGPPMQQQNYPPPASMMQNYPIYTPAPPGTPEKAARTAALAFLWFGVALFMAAIFPGGGALGILSLIAWLLYKACRGGT